MYKKSNNKIKEANKEVGIKRKRNQTAVGGREGVGERAAGSGRKKEKETNTAKGKAALGNGTTWNRKRDNVVLKRTVG
jgi:hypothetical protein